MFQIAHPPSHDDLAMAMLAMLMPPRPSTPPPRKWIKRWQVQDTILSSGKLMLLKWVTENVVAQYTGVAPALEEQDAEENEILYLCTFEGCGKGFADAGSLRKHAHTHGEKQFICHYDGCGKRFVDSSKLKRHFLIHTGEKHFVCPFEGCGKAFSLDFNLRSHMRTHTGENYHACPYEDCGKRYAHEYKLRAHMRNHHDKNIPEMSPPPMPIERDPEFELSRYRDAEREQERMELDREAVAAKPPSTKSAPHPPPRQQDSVPSDRPFACPHPGCTKRYIHEYKLNLHLRNSHHADENHLEYLEERGGDSEGEEDVDEGTFTFAATTSTPAAAATSRTPAARGSGRGKLKLISKRGGEPAAMVVEDEEESSKQKKRRKGGGGGEGKVPKEVDLNLRMRVSNELDYYGGAGKQAAAADSEETEEDEAENTEEEEGLRYYRSRGDRSSMVDEEDTEDDGEQF